MWNQGSPRYAGKSKVESRKSKGNSSGCRHRRVDFDAGSSHRLPEAKRRDTLYSRGSARYDRFFSPSLTFESRGRQCDRKRRPVSPEEHHTTEERHAETHSEGGLRSCGGSGRRPPIPPSIRLSDHQTTSPVRPSMVPLPSVTIAEYRPAAIPMVEKVAA